MSKHKHYRREGTLPDQVRDLQYNGGSSCGGPFPMSHPKMRSPDASFTGFAYDGMWRQLGKSVSPSLTTDLGNSSHDLDTNKWTPSGAIPYIQTSEYLKATASSAGTSVSFDGNGWVLRGGVDIELDVESAVPQAAVGLENVVFLEVSSAKSSVTYRVKLFREDAGGVSVAASVTNVGGQIGKTATTDTMVRLVIRREVNNSTMNISAIGATDGYMHLWQGAAEGELTVRFGVETSVATSWAVFMRSFNHNLGKHTFSSVASWSREVSEGVVMEEFVGDELNSRWSVASSGNGAVATGSHDPLTERGMVMSSAAGVGGVDLEYCGVTGDFETSSDIHWSIDGAHSQGVGTEEIGWGFEIRSAPTGYPRHRVSVIRKPASTVLRVETWPSQAGPPSILASDSTLPTDDTNMSYRVTFRVVGDRLSIVVHDTLSDKEVAATSFKGSTVPSAPWVPAFIMDSGANGVTSASVLPFFIKSLEPMSDGELPESYHSISGVAGSSELQEYDVGLTSDSCAVRIVDTGSQLPSFGICGMSRASGGADFNQAMPGGVVGDVSVIGGTLWIPVGRQGVANQGGFVGIDFKLDRIYRVRENETATFAGRVSDRNLCLGYGTPSPATNSPAAGRPIRVQSSHSSETSAGALGHDVTVWSTDYAVRVYDGQLASAATLFENAQPNNHGVTLVQRCVLAPPVRPESGSNYAAIVIGGTRKDDVAVAVYRNASAIVSQGNEASPGAHADVIYTGAPPVAGINSAFSSGKLPGPASASSNSILDMDAKCFSEGVSIAVARGSDGAGILFDPSGDKKTYSPVNLVSPIPGDSLSFSPVSVRLTKDASPTSGYIAFSTAADVVVGNVTHKLGSAEVSAIQSGRIRYKADVGDVDALASGFSDQKSTAAGLCLVESPPDGGVGVTLVWGTSSSDSETLNGVEVRLGALESTILAVSGLPVEDWHVGGARHELLGEGLGSLSSVKVGGVECFRLRVDTSTSPQRAKFSARALGWAMGLESPVVPDLDLESSATRSYEVVLRFRDGGTMTFPGGFTYKSDLCSERALARTIGGFPEELMPNNPKDNTWQRHILLSVALHVCRAHEDFLSVLESDSYIETATGDQLRWLSGMYGAPELSSTMSDQNLRKFIRASAFGSSLTVKSIKDILEPLFGSRPTVTEGFREFTITVPADTNVSRSFFSDTADPNDASGGYFNRDYYAGVDPRVSDASEIVGRRKAAGVKYTIIIVEPS